MTVRCEKEEAQCERAQATNCSNVRPRGRHNFFILQTKLSLPFVSCTPHSFFIMVQSCLAGLSCQHFACLLCGAIRIYITLTVVIALLFIVIVLLNGRPFHSTC